MQNLSGVLAAGFEQQWARNWDQKVTGSGTPVVLRYVNTADGVYDWTRFDVFAAAAKAAGKKVLFTLGVPAAFVIDRADLGGGHFGAKSAMCPTGATELGKYATGCVAMLNRLRVTHGFAGADVAIELWNEIEGPGNLHPSELGALPAMAKHVVPLLRAELPGVTILTPSARDDDTAHLVGNFLAGSDGAGGKGGDWVDGIAWHFYGLNQPWTYKYTMDVYRQNAINAGYPSLPIYVTESGMLSATDNTAKIMQRRMLVFAACGAKLFNAYATSYPVNTLESIANEWNAAANAIVGKTISSCWKNRDGSVSAVIDGATVSF